MERKERKKQNIINLTEKCVHCFQLNSVNRVRMVNLKERKRVFLTQKKTTAEYSDEKVSDMNLLHLML